MMGGPRPFPETSWSLLQACRADDRAAAEEPLGRLFRKYWGPVYFYVRRTWGADVTEAKDLTQAFFLNLLDKAVVEGFDADRGRFRTFVCSALKHFLMNARRAEQAARRRPEQGVASFEQLQVAERGFDVPAADASPDAQLSADLRTAVVDAAVAALRAQYAGSPRGVMVDLFVRYHLDRLPGERLRYEDLARDAGLSVAQVTTGLHWARGAFEAALLAEMRDLVGSEDDLWDEARELFGIERP